MEGQSQPDCQICSKLHHLKTIELTPLCHNHHFGCPKCCLQSQSQNQCIKCAQNLQANNAPIINQQSYNINKKDEVFLILKEEIKSLGEIQLLLNNHIIRRSRQIIGTGNNSINQEEQITLYNTAITGQKLSESAINLAASRTRQQEQEIKITRKQLQGEQKQYQSFQQFSQFYNITLDILSILIVLTCFMTQLIFLGLHFLESISNFNIQARYTAIIMYSALLVAVIITLSFSDVFCCHASFAKIPWHGKVQILMDRITQCTVLPINLFIAFIGLIIAQQKHNKRQTRFNTFVLPILNIDILKWKINEKPVFYSVFLVPNIFFIIIWIYVYSIELWQIYQTSIMDSISIFLSCLLFVILPALDERYAYQLNEYYKSKETKAQRLSFSRTKSHNRTSMKVTDKTIKLHEFFN